MRIFLTGASGFIGSRILPALQASGHQVIGLARSDTAAQTLKALGVEVHRGTLDAPDSLLAGVEGADAVIHTAFDHDFSRFAANCEKDRQAILTMGRALQGSARPLVITSGTLMGDDGSGVPARESFFNSGHPSPRTASELAGQQLLEAGVDVGWFACRRYMTPVRQGLLTSYIERASPTGWWPCAAREATAGPPPMSMDVARLYVSALLQGAGASATMRWTKRDRVTRYCYGNCSGIKPAADPPG
ncbi:nucleoside-diphosphate-sugar epimerase [Klebsiella aerogenes]|nr:nucleoside-diphosphate-sugar epimerase [Klebsiella aerogenes]